MDRDIGGLAEADLVRWTRQVGITPNKSGLDLEGWDYLLQFPFAEPPEGTTLDRRPARIECLVQVKGLEAARTRKSIKLSNWEKLVRSPLPAFFLVIDYGTQNDPGEAYLVHVGEEWIGKVLRRLRKLSAQDAEKLHQKTLDLTWGEADRLPALDGVGLMNAIKAYVGDDLDEYQRRKLEIREVAGDPVPAQMHISLAFRSEEELWTELVDFAIGLRSEIPTSGMTIEKDIRFNVPAERIHYDSDGMVQVGDRPTTPGKLVLRNEASTLRSVFPAKVYEPYWFFPRTTIPQEYVKKRVSFEIGDAIVRPESNDGSLNIHFSQAKEFQSLREHANLWRVVSILQEALRGPAVIEIQDTEGNTVASGRLPNPYGAQLDERLLEAARAVDNLWFVARQFDISPETKMALIHILQQQLVTEQLRHLCDSNYVFDAIVGEVDGEEVENGFFESAAAFPFLRRVVFGSISIVVAVAVAGPLARRMAESTDRVGFKVEGPRRVLLRHYVVQDNDEEDRRLEERLLKELTEELESGGYEVIQLLGP